MQLKFKIFRQAVTIFLIVGSIFSLSAVIPNASFYSHDNKAHMVVTIFVNEESFALKEWSKTLKKLACLFSNEQRYKKSVDLFLVQDHERDFFRNILEKINEENNKKKTKASLSLICLNPDEEEKATKEFESSFGKVLERADTSVSVLLVWGKRNDAYAQKQEEIFKKDYFYIEDISTLQRTEFFRKALALFSCCARCAKPCKSRSRCNRCKEVFYCTRECQKKDWKEHQLRCENKRLLEK